VTSSNSSAAAKRPKADPKIAAAVWKPLLMRGAVALIFGLITVFWTAPPLAVACYLLTAVMVVTGKALYDFGAVEGAPADMHRTLGMAALLYILIGLSVALLQSGFTFAWMGGGGLAAVGLLEVWAWAKARKSYVPARELLIPGVVTTGTGVAMMVGNHLDLHGLLGIAGGGHIIVAVFTIIAGISYRFDAK
jgi:hypothetical protein